HHVRAWREFQRSVAPRMEAERIELSARQRRLEQARRLHNETVAQLGALELKAKQALADADRQIQSRKEEIDALDALLAGRLKDFLSHVPKSLHIDWNAPALAAEVQKRLAAIARDLDELRKDVRALRNSMTERAGPVADWLNMREKEHTDPQRLLEHQVCIEQAESVIEWFGVMAYGPYVDAMNKEMHSYFAIASTFVQELELFDRRITSFNTELQKALKETATFARFRDLSVTVRSGVGKINYLETLRAMRDTGNSRGSTLRSIASQDRELPRDEDVQLMRNFRDLLPEDGVFRVNLSDQVRLECSLIENGKARLITNEEEFRGVSSNGNTALIVAMFLMGFVQMI
uniref:ATP-binding protein n=1 Tax=Pseudomonas aeruginosa TaxID=287 RepID=UPI000AD19E0B